MMMIMMVTARSGRKKKMEWREKENGIEGNTENVLEGETENGMEGE